MNRQVQYSESLKLSDRRTALGMLLVEAVDVRRLEGALVPRLSEYSAKATGQADGIGRRIKAFEKFFSENGFSCPLGKQLEMIRRKGFPAGNPLVQALLFAEMTTGLLMGAQDLGSIEGDLVYDLAARGETFLGMRGEVTCHPNEVVLRDAKAIIASVFQGPDQRTKLTSQTKDVIFFIFSAPGISADEVREALQCVKNLFANASAHMSEQVCDDGIAS